MEYARRLAQMEADGRVAPPVDAVEPPLLRYGPLEQRLDSVIDLLQFLRATVQASAGQKPPPVRPVRRPRTALEKAREEIELAQLDELSALVLGGGVPLS